MQTVGGAADMMNYYNQYLGKPDHVGQDIARLRAITAAQVRSFAQTLKPTSRVVVYAVPGKQKLDDVPTPKLDASATGAAAESVNADEPWRNQAATAGRRAGLAASCSQGRQAVERSERFFSTERPGLPLVSARLVLRTGSDSDPLGKSGDRQLYRGHARSGHRNAQRAATSQGARAPGSELSTDSSMDDTSAEIRSLKRNFTDATTPLADVVLHPSFPTEEITRQRTSRLAELCSAAIRPRSLLKASSAVLDGPRHPYSFPSIGTEGSIRATSRDDLGGVLETEHRPRECAALVVAGEITMAELQPLAEKELGAWKGSAPAERELAAPAEPEKRM